MAVRRKRVLTPAQKAAKAARAKRRRQAKGGSTRNTKVPLAKDRRTMRSKSYREGAARVERTRKQYKRNQMKPPKGGLHPSKTLAKAGVPNPPRSKVKGRRKSNNPADVTDAQIRYFIKHGKVAQHGVTMSAIQTAHMHRTDSSGTRLKKSGTQHARTKKATTGGVRGTKKSTQPKAARKVHSKMKSQQQIPKAGRLPKRPRPRPKRRRRR